jgi:dihydrofolate reductase
MATPSGTEDMMRELIVDSFSTVDGWGFGRKSSAYFGLMGPDLDAWINEQLAHPHVMVMGSNTYRAMAEITASGDDPTFKPMEEMPKVVFSTSLKEPLTWRNTTVVAEDIEVAVPAMKEESGGPLRVIGSFTLARSLFKAGLVDRLRLMVFPQVLGETGAERILDGLPDFNLHLDTTRILDDRIVLLDYTVE